jgi:hypothetical protein
VKSNGDLLRQLRVRWRRGGTVTATGAVCLVLLAGCGGSSAKSPTATVAPPATATAVPPTPTPVPDAKIGKIVWTASIDPVTNAPGKPTETFRSDATALYAVIYVSDLRAGSVLSASWTYNDTALNGVGTSVVPTSLYTGGYVQFHLARATGNAWPSGTYRIAVSLDGKVERTASIDVADA